MPTQETTFEIRADKDAYASFLADHIRSEAQQIALMAADDATETRALLARIGYLEGQVKMLKGLYMPTYELNHATASRVI